MKKNEVILALDLSLDQSGYAVCFVGERFEVLESGVVSNQHLDNHGEKLLEIYLFLERIIRIWNVDLVVKEGIYVDKFKPEGTLGVSYVSGVAKLCIWNLLGIEMEEFSPKTVKKTVSDTGKATKSQVQQSVFKLTGIKTKTHDESDAIAVAYTYYKKRYLDTK